MTDRKYPPRHGDLPRAQLMSLAARAIAMHGGPLKVKVFFKFTCPFCRTRCTFEEANMLFESGTCEQCGQTAPVDFGGFSMEVTL
jgi:hypothetical protein